MSRLMRRLGAGAGTQGFDTAGSVATACLAQERRCGLFALIERPAAIILKINK